MTVRWKIYLFATLIVLQHAGHAASQPECTQENLVGDWQLVSAEDFISGKWVQSFGDKPIGYFSFSKEGFASVQFMKAPLDSENAPSSSSYLAYFGKYSVNQEKCTFSISVEGSLDRKRLRTTAIRPFEFERKDILHVGDGVTFRRTFVRKSPAQESQIKK